MSTTTLAAEHFWVNKSNFNTAEKQYYETLSKEYAKILSEEEIAISADGGCELANLEDASVPADKPAQQLGDVAVPVAKLTKPKKSKKSKALKLQEAELAAANIFDTPSSVPNALAEEEQQQPMSPSAFQKPPSVVAAVEAGVAELKSNAAKKNKKKSKATAAAKRAAERAAELAPASAAEAATTPTNGGGGGSSLSPTKMLDISLKLNSNSSSASANVKKNPSVKGTASNSQCTLVSEIAKAREHIKNSLEKMDGIATLAASPVSGEVLDRISAVEKDNADLRKLVEGLKTLSLESQKRIAALEAQLNKTGAAPVAAAAPAKKAEAEDDDGVDLFASESDDEESAEAARIREERLAAYAAKKSKKPALIAKSSLVLDVKPWDDETDLTVMETELRKITLDGLLWGASKFVPVAFGIKKISISCVVEDEKVSIDWLTEEIEKLEDYVQSVDVAAFNKI